MPAIGKAEFEAHKALLRPHLYDDSNNGANGGASSTVGIDAFIDVIAVLRAKGDTGGDTTDAALLARINGSQQLSQLSQPYVVCVCVCVRVCVHTYVRAHVRACVRFSVRFLARQRCSPVCSCS